MALDAREVRHVARLANLALEETEITRLASDLASILHHVRQLEELDTDAVEPTTFMTVPRMPLRADESRTGLDNESAIAGAPRVRDGAFGVPTFVEEG